MLRCQTRSDAHSAQRFANFTSPRYSLFLVENGLDFGGKLGVYAPDAFFGFTEARP